MKKEIYVALAGGLGNQLFQLNCAINNSQGTVNVVSCLGNPRATNGKPDIQGLCFSQRISFLECTKKHILVKKVFALLISMTERRSALNQSWLISRVICAVAAVPLSFHFSRLIIPRIGRGLGFDEEFGSRSGNFLVGYFQSYSYSRSQATLEEIRSLECESSTKRYVELMNEVVLVRPLLVHVRLGDYKLETNFGVLTSQYFEDAINFQFEKSSINKIWLFSDEVDEAIKLIPSRYLNYVKVVDGNNLTPAETLNLMRNCSNFVTSNSTFSWWAAFLAIVENPVVCYPTPWFSKGNSPLDLIPSSWIPISRN